MDTPPPDDQAGCAEGPNWDPFWDSEACSEQQANEAEEMSNLVYDPDTPLLPATICADIAEALSVEPRELQPIRCAIQNLMLRREVASMTAPKLAEAFSTLHRIARSLTEAAEELRHADYDVGRLLDLAYTSRGQRGMASGLQLLIDPLTPKGHDWWVSHLAERADEIYEDDALAMIEAVRQRIAMLLELQPRKSRGSPGKEFRNSVIRDLAKVYSRAFGEPPTCTPSGRFMLLCQLVLDALSVDTTGLENAVRRALQHLKAN